MRSPVLNKTHRLTTTHTLLTSSPCGLVKKQFAACSKAGLRVAAASQVTNWQSCFPLPLIVGVGVFSSAVESPCQRPRSALEREWEGNDGNTIRVFYFCFPPLARFLFSSALSVVFSPSVFVSFSPPRSLSLRAISHIINLSHSPSFPPLVYPVIMLPLQWFAFFFFNCVSLCFCIPF